MILKTKPFSWPIPPLTLSEIWPKLRTQRTKTFSPSLPFIVGGCGEAQEIAFLFPAWVPHQMRKMKLMLKKCGLVVRDRSTYWLPMPSTLPIWGQSESAGHTPFTQVSGLVLQVRGRRNVQTPSYFLISSVNGDKWTNSNNLRPKKKMQKPL